MLLNDFLKTNAGRVNISTGQITGASEKPVTAPKKNESGESFADALQREIRNKGGVEFSGHAMRRIESRSIDIIENDKLGRLNRGVEMAARKGCGDALVLIDTTAFVVSVKNNKVITTLTGDDLKGSVFTNIDSTIII
jgi:flagellar operon protein